MKYRFLGLAVVGIVVGSAAIAVAAQPPPAPNGTTTPNAPPAAPAPSATTAPSAAPTTTAAPAAPGAPGAQAAPEAPAAEPPAAAPPEPPPAAAPEPQPMPTLGGVPGRDTTTPAPTEAEKKPNPFRFSWLTWNHTVTTTALGVGRDNIGSDGEEYTQELTFTPRYYFYDKPLDQVYATAKIGAQVELTNSDTTTKYREPLFEDMQLGIGYAHLFFQSRDKETKIYFGPTFNLVLPTSKESSSQGKYLVTALGVGPRAQINLLGPKAKGLNNVLAYGSVTWSHLFARSYEPTNSDVDIYPRQNAYGQSYASDQLDMKSFDMDRFKFVAGYFLPLYGDLYFANSWTFQTGLKHDFSNSSNNGCDVSIYTNPCLTAERDPTHTAHGAKTIFDVSLSYDFFEMVRWDVGYQNETAQIAPDGTRYSVFYSPSAAFYTDIIVLLDGVLEKTKVVNLEQKKAALLSAGKRGVY